jgi:hypothetical protein
MPFEKVREIYGNELKTFNSEKTVLKEDLNKLSNLERLKIKNRINKQIRKNRNKNILAGTIALIIAFLFFFWFLYSALYYKK